MWVRGGWDRRCCTCRYNEDGERPHPQICPASSHVVLAPQYTTSYTVAFLSPEPVTMYLSSGETSQLSTDEDSLDWEEEGGTGEGGREGEKI